MARKTQAEPSIDEQIGEVKRLDSMFTKLIKDAGQSIKGENRTEELNRVVSQFNDLISKDAFNYNRTKTISQSSYSYMANMLLGKPLTEKERKDPKEIARNDALNRARLEEMFSGGDAQMAGYFLSQASDKYHILDEIESVCAYMYQLDEAINVLRDNVLNNEQSTTDLPFDIEFDGIDSSKLGEYRKIVSEVFIESGMKQKLNDHITPKTIKFGSYMVMTIPYSEIGVKMLDRSANQTHSMFNFGGSGFTDLAVASGVKESSESEVDTGFVTCMESVTSILDNIYDKNEKKLEKYGSKETICETIKYNMENITISEAATPPNVTGISEATFNGMTDDLKDLVKKALGENNKKFNASLQYDKQKHTKFHDATIGITTSEDIPGSFNKLIDPRQMVPIKIFDHTIGYYYFENYDYARMGTSITDILSNQINFNDQNMVIDNIVGTILKRLKYGDIVKGDQNFKAMILNCVLYAERRNNPIRIKFVPCEYVTEFKVNCDENNNGQPVLLKSLIFARLYISLLLFNLTAIFTKSTDTEFYYLKENAITPSYEDQVADIIEQFRNSNVDMSSILSGNLLHGNRAINKRYFMSTGTSDIKPFDVDVVGGQNIDIHNDLMTDLKKMAIGSTGVPSVAVDYMDEIEFATILKMTNTKTLNRANNLQTDLNGNETEGLTGLCIKLTRFNRPGAIPEEDLMRMRCVLRKNNTINNNISADEINNTKATVGDMVDTWYKGENTQNPEIVEYEKEEMKRRLTIMMTGSLPWGELEKILDEVKIDARAQKARNDMLANQADNTETE